MEKIILPSRKNPFCVFTKISLGLWSANNTKAAGYCQTRGQNWSLAVLAAQSSLSSPILIGAALVFWCGNYGMCVGLWSPRFSIYVVQIADLCQVENKGRGWRISPSKKEKAKKSPPRVGWSLPQHSPGLIPKELETKIA